MWAQTGFSAIRRREKKYVVFFFTCHSFFIILHYLKSVLLQIGVLLLLIKQIDNWFLFEWLVFLLIYIRFECPLVKWLMLFLVGNLFRFFIHIHTLSFARTWFDSASTKAFTSVCNVRKKFTSTSFTILLHLLKWFSKLYISSAKYQMIRMLQPCCSSGDQHQLIQLICLIFSGNSRMWTWADEFIWMFKNNCKNQRKTIN